MALLRRTLGVLGAVALGALFAHFSQGFPWLGTVELRSLSSARAALPVATPTQSTLRRSSLPIELALAMGKPFANGKIMTGDTPHRLILFTFDDGPDREHTPALLDALDERGVKAVFFLSAWRIAGDTVSQREQAQIAIDAIRRGHMMASHSLDHLQLPLLNTQDAHAQILGAQHVFETVFGARPWLFRPPGGARSERTDALVAELGYTTVLWNLGTGDVQVHTPQEVLETWKRVLDRREREANQNGGIILLHDTHDWSVEGFRLIHDELMRRNCRFLERGEELYDIVEDPSFFFHPRKDASASEKSPSSLPDLDLLEARQKHLRKLTETRCG